VCAPLVDGVLPPLGTNAPITTGVLGLPKGHRGGCPVYTTDLGEEGVDLGKLYDYDVILLDVNLPDMSGYEVPKTLRVNKVSTPVLILSGLAGIDDKVRGLGFGADDYMTKPFHKDELVARIHAIVRRSKSADNLDCIIRTAINISPADAVNHRAQAAAWFCALDQSTLRDSHFPSFPSSPSKVMANRKRPPGVRLDAD
jgi:DNA-binding response OmpR family regulator